MEIQGKMVMLRVGVLGILCGLPLAPFSGVGGAQGTNTVPLFEVTPVESSIKFSVKASVGIQGTFEKWDAKLTFGSADVTTAKLEIRIQAESVNTGSGMKNNKLKGKDFFFVEENPLIIF